MLAFQPLSENAVPKIEKKNPKLVSESRSSKTNVVIAEEPPKEEPKPRDKNTIKSVSKKLNGKNYSMLEDLDLQSWNSIFNSLNLSMFVSQVFSEFEFVSFADNVLTLKKSDELINPTEGLKTEFLEAIAVQLGQRISLVIESGEVRESPAAFEKKMAQNQLDEDKDALLKNAAVKEILDTFDGKIIDESIKKVSS